MCTREGIFCQSLQPTQTTPKCLASGKRHNVHDIRDLAGGLTYAPAAMHFTRASEFREQDSGREPSVSNSSRRPDGQEEKSVGET